MIGLVVAVVVGLIGIVAFAALYMFSAQELEISEEVMDAVLTVEDAEEWFEIDIKKELEEWDSERYFDGSAQIYYYYNDEEESIYINCNLTYEPKRSDALMAYGIEWGGLKLSNQVGPGDPIGLDEQSDLFEWGDASKFAFQTLDGEPYGLAFVARKDGKVFFLDLKETFPWRMAKPTVTALAGTAARVGPTCQRRSSMATTCTCAVTTDA